MSRSDEGKGEQQGAESTATMWVEPEPGPSRRAPGRQGYCGYCRVLYTNLDQHLSSLRHLDSVRASARGSSATSSSSSQSKMTLLERFLQDVMKHHPHSYNDPRPSHADLPAVSTPLVPRAELDEVFSEDDRQSQGQHPSPDNASFKQANQQKLSSSHSQSGKGVDNGAEERLSAPIRRQERGSGSPTHTQENTQRKYSTRKQAPPQFTQGTHPSSQAPPPMSQAPPPSKQDLSVLPQAKPLFTQAPPPVHRKAHRKTNRRKNRDSSPSPSDEAPVPAPLAFTQSGPCSCPGPAPHFKQRPPLSLGLGTGPGPPSKLQPWLSWQRARRAELKEEAFSSDSSDAVGRTIEEVIQVCCYGVSSSRCQQEESESFHFSIPVSMETQSEDWDTPVQVKLNEGRGLSHTEGRGLSRLMDFQVPVEDQVYSYQLDSALHSEEWRGGGAATEAGGFMTLPIDEILPAPQHLPESFRGKTWAQVEQEDEQKVERLVQQFRRGKFVCYFDTESLARFGRRSLRKRQGDESGGADATVNILPLLEHEEDQSAPRRMKRRRGRSFRLASRCQVVKVSHGTQTVRLVVPAVRQTAPEALPCAMSDCPAIQDTERTPEAQMWRRLPSSYSSIITPLQPRTSVVLLLCSPSGSTPTDTPAPESKCRRRRRRPLDLQRLKVKYKQLPVKFYELGSNRILKNPPKGYLWSRSSAPSVKKPPCVRQLFRSLSPDLNTDSQDSGTTKHSSVRRRGSTSIAPPPLPFSRPEQGAGGRTRPQNSKRTIRAQTTPPPPRREGLRRASPTHSAAQRGRGRRGRGYERGRR